MIDLASLLGELSERRSIFHSEADFQHALAWLLHEHAPAADIRLEVPLRTSLGIATVDVMLLQEGRQFVLELKYKTREVSVDIGTEMFRLRSHVALPLGRYDVLKDLQRIESIAELGEVYSGAVVFLTNDSAYWSPPRSDEDTSAAFSLVDGRTISGEMDWSVRASPGTKKGRESPINIRGEYLLQWNEYSSIPSRSYSRFRSLILSVSNQT